VQIYTLTTAIFLTFEGRRFGKYPKLRSESEESDEFSDLKKSFRANQTALVFAIFAAFAVLPT